jgi:hypothetical protein
VPCSQRGGAGRLHHGEHHRAAAPTHGEDHHRLPGAGRPAGRCGARSRLGHTRGSFAGLGADARDAARRAPQAAWRPAPSPRFTASSARARRRSATCWPSPARRALRAPREPAPAAPAADAPCCAAPPRARCPWKLAAARGRPCTSTQRARSGRRA